MLTGFTTPLTASGGSSLVDFPPWYYAGIMFAIEYWTDPQETAALLPPGLKPSSDQGYCVAHFADWQACTDKGEELLDPVQSQYKEFFVLIGAEFEGEAVFYCPFIYVTQDVSLLRGQIQGLPKQLASVHMTRAFDVENPAASRDGEGGIFGACLSWRERRLAQARLKITGKTNAPYGFGTRPTFGIRHFANLQKGAHQDPLVNDLVQMRGRDVVLGDVFEAQATLSYVNDKSQELWRLSPEKIGRASRSTVGLTIDDLALIANLNEK